LPQRDLRLGEDLREDAEAGGIGRIDVSVVIVSWNVRELLRGCIKSVVTAQDGLSVQIIVIDNASDDESADVVRDEFPEVHLVHSQTNLGFSQANNVGLGLAEGRYVLFLNPDTVLHEAALILMVAFLESHSDFDVVGPRLISPDGSTQWVCARRLPSPALVLFQALYFHRLPLIGNWLLNRLIAHYDLSQNQEVEAISGAAMLARRTVVHDLRGFDELFLYTAEDMDLCLRLRQHGSRIFYLADATIVHFGGESSSQAWVRSGTMGVLSTQRYLARSHGRFPALLYRLVVQVVQMPVMVVVGLMKALLRRSGPGDLRRRLAFAKSIWRWRVSE
jgi:GT2 family glycosyltransferase